MSPFNCPCNQTPTCSLTKSICYKINLSFKKSPTPFEELDYLYFSLGENAQFIIYAIL